MTGIYKITSPTGKIYIGQAKNLETRFKDYKKLNCKNQTRLYNSFKKHGIENHQFDIIEYCNIEDLNCSERFWQDQFDVIGKNGLNCMLINTENLLQVQSKETREKRSKTMSGEGNPMFGLKGKDHPAFNFKLTQKMKDAIGKANKGRDRAKGELSPCWGRIITQEEKDRIRTTKLDLIHPKSKKVIDTSSGIIYSTITEAAKKHKINFDYLRQMLSGRSKNTTSLKYYIENELQDKL